MKLLLDELRHRAHEVAGQFAGQPAVDAMGWATIKNGRLLKLAEKLFDVFITVDRNLSFQLPLPRFSIAVVVLRAKSNRLEYLEPLAPRILAALRALKPGKALVLT